MAATKASSKATKASSKKTATKAATKKAAASAKKSVASTKKATAAKKAPAKAAAKRSPAPSSKAAAKKAPQKPPAKSAKSAKSAKKAPQKAPAKAAPKAPARRSWADQTPVKRAPIKAKKGPLDKFLQGQLAALQEERATYLRQATSLKAEADLLAAEREPGDVQFDEESGEGDTLAVERERDLALSAQASAAVEEIDLAVAKIHEGTYGICEQCGTSIPKERLRALPYAALCVQCKSAGFSRR